MRGGAKVKQDLTAKAPGYWAELLFALTYREFWIALRSLIYGGYANRNGKGAFYAAAWIDGAKVHIYKYHCPDWAQVKHESGNGLDTIGARISVELEGATDLLRYNELSQVSGFRKLGDLRMKGQKVAVWIAVGIGVGVAIGAATHSMALWLCLGVVAGAIIGAAVGRRKGG